MRLEASSASPNGFDVALSCCRSQAGRSVPGLPGPATKKVPLLEPLSKVEPRALVSPLQASLQLHVVSWQATYSGCACGYCDHASQCTWKPLWPPPTVPNWYIQQCVVPARPVLVLPGLATGSRTQL